MKVITAVGNLPMTVTGVSQDSRLIKPGYIFIAIRGDEVSGLNYLKQALENGAALIVSADPLPPEITIPAIQVEDVRKAMTGLANAIYGDPLSKIKYLAVTGTKGKSGTIHLIQSILKAAGEKCGLIGTIGYDTGNRLYDAPLTTPGIDTICAITAEMVDNGLGWVAAEVSSHALVQGRVDSVKFAAAGFTNLSHEHLDYHGSMEDYFMAKTRLFQLMPSDAFAVINVSDSWGQRMVDYASCRVVTYGIPGSGAVLIVTNIDHSLAGGRFRIDWAGGSFEVNTPLIGLYQGENIALAAAMALGLGFKEQDIACGVAALNSVPGRMEAIKKGQPFTVLVDYAHAPQPLERALISLKPLCSGRLIVVFGAGGDRDRSKRPEMGRVAAEQADIVIITSDNSRNEDPVAIAGMIMEGVSTRNKQNVDIVINRRSAIRTAIEEAKPGDAVYIGGKGHERFQLVKGVKHPFDDRVVAAQELTRLGWTEDN